jgi:hypothetical protein
LRDSENQQEFRSYRQALFILYAGVLSLGSLLGITSIVVELFFKRSEPAPEPTPADLVSCNDDVRALLDGLAHTAGEVHELALGDVNLGARWEDFASGWRREWIAVKEACQFDTLAETGLGSAYDAMADVHAKLPVLQLEYREMIRRFTDTQVPKMREMRRSLERSRKNLQERSGTPPPPDSIEMPDAG